MSDSEPTTPKQPILCSARTPPPVIRTPPSYDLEESYNPGEFIKPDPLMTRQETRTFLLNELEGLLVDRIAYPEEKPPFTNEQFARFLKSHSWPKGRLYYLRDRLVEEKGTDTSARSVGTIAFEIIRSALLSEKKEFEYSDEICRTAMGFVETDILPWGRTIMSYWNHSPFEALRQAPPLTEEDEDDYFVESLWETPITIPLYSVLAYVALVVAWMIALVASLRLEQNQTI
jgi:hypothetical protein